MKVFLLYIRLPFLTCPHFYQVFIPFSFSVFRTFVHQVHIFYYLNYLFICFFLFIFLYTKKKKLFSLSPFSLLHAQIHLWLLLPDPKVRLHILIHYMTELTNSCTLIYIWTTASPLLLSSIPVFCPLFLLQHVLPLLSALSLPLSKMGSVLPILFYFWDGNRKEQWYVNLIATRRITPPC